MDMLDVKKIPRIQFEVHNEELIGCIKELHFQVKTQERQIQKLKKDMEARPSETDIADGFALISGSIEIEALFLKAISQRNPPKEDNLLKKASFSLGDRIGQVSDCLKHLLHKLTSIEKKIDGNQSEGIKLTNQKCGSLQSQLDDLRKAQITEQRRISERLDISMGEYQNKVREVETKTLWQINDCQTKLKDRVSEQMVKDAVKEAEGRMMAKVKESLIRTNIDPAKIDSLEQSCSKIEKDFASKITTAEAKIDNLATHVQMAILSKKEFNDSKIENQKRFGNLHQSLSEHSRKFMGRETQEQEARSTLKQLGTNQEAVSKQIASMGRTLQNLKLSEDFQRLMETLNPHKLCEIDTTLSILAAKDSSLERELNVLKAYVQKMREKNEICNLLAPQKMAGDTFSKEEANKLVQDLVISHPQFKKIQLLEAQMYESKAYGEMINEFNKRLSRIQKEFDIQPLTYTFKGLEEYVKREILMIATKLSNVEGTVAELNRKRPLSAKRTLDSRITSSVSYKKLVPVDCISCFQNPLERTAYRK